MNKLYIVGISRPIGLNKLTAELEWRWELVGVFDTEEKALDACKDDLCFIGPVELNQDYGIDTLPDWEGSYYPHRENDKRIRK